MRDSNRSVIFGKWIKRNFPKANKIAEIASGGNPVEVESSKFTLPKHDVRMLHFKPGEYDLVIGMHPDGATIEIIRLAEEANADFAMVPCCIIPTQKGIDGFNGWIKHLKYLSSQRGFKVQEYLLRMKGKNIVLVGRR